MEVYQYIGNAGVLIALFFFVKHLVSQMREDRRFMEDRLTKIIESYNETTSDTKEILTELITMLKIRNGGK